VEISLVAQLVQLMEEGSAAVLPGGIIADLRPAHRAGLLALEPGLDALITEDVAALQHNGRVEGVMADWTQGARSIQLVFGRRSLRVLKEYDLRNEQTTSFSLDILTIFFLKVTIAFFSDLPRSTSSNILAPRYRAENSPPDTTSRPE